MEMNLTFDKKFSSLLLNLKDRISPINISPKYLRHYICDFIELYTIFYKESVTRSEILDLFDDCDFNLAIVDRQSIKDLTKAEIDEKKENEVTYLFQCLEYRKNIISIKYPFLTTVNSIDLDSDLSSEQKIYLSFLFASNLSIFSEFQADLTSEFEYFVYCAAKKFFPLQTIIKQFGKNSDYTGNAQTKIRALATDLNIKTRDIEIQNITGSQEKGLDLIAWIPFSDQDTNMLIYMFQCACGDGWIKKFSETRRYFAYYDFYKLKPESVIAVSYAFNIMGKFEKSDDMVSGESLFFDRLRLMEYINFHADADCDQDDLQSIMLIDKLITTPVITLNL